MKKGRRNPAFFAVRKNCSCPKAFHIYENEGLSVRYTYDKLNRLIREDNKALDQTYLISYDNNGNILTKENFAYSFGKEKRCKRQRPFSGGMKATG